MTRAARTLTLAVAVAVVSVSRGADPTPVDTADVLRSLPRPPEWPASLYAPAPPPSSAANPLDRPYFVTDPRLDPPQFPPPGWFAGLELDVLKPHVKNGLIGTVPNAAQAVAGASTVALPGAPLDWVGSPRAVVGSRLPAGFGEVSLAYRGFATQGQESLVGAEGLEAVNSRLEVNVIDFDYGSREFSLWPGWEMKWTFGSRLLFVYFDSRADQSVPQSAAGSGVFEMRETNHLTGVGPHLGLELARHLATEGLTAVVRTDLATEFSRIRQGFFILSATPGPPALALGREAHDAVWMTPAVVSAQVGIAWQPPAHPCIRLFAGYQYEYWWNVGSNVTNANSRADLWNQGVVLQAAWRY
jgi:hypothetical protein